MTPFRLTIVVILALVGVAVAKDWPEIQRYLKVRNM